VFGTVISGNTTKGYTVQFDMFPSEHKRTTVIRRRLTTLSPNEEECNETTTNMEYATVEDVDEEDEGDTTGRRKGKKSDHIKESFEDFAKLDAELIITATVFDMRYGDDLNDVVTWEILNDNQHVLKSEDPMKYPLSWYSNDKSTSKTIDWIIYFSMNFYQQLLVMLFLLMNSTVIFDHLIIQQCQLVILNFMMTTPKIQIGLL
jgi:hypothetical protein